MITHLPLSECRVNGFQCTTIGFVPEVDRTIVSFASDSYPSWLQKPCLDRFNDHDRVTVLPLIPRLVQICELRQHSESAGREDPFFDDGTSIDGFAVKKSAGRIIS